MSTITRTANASRPTPAPARAEETLVTGRFLLVVGSTLAYFVAIGALMATLPLFVRGPLGAGTAAVGLAQGAFYGSALLVRPWAGRLADRVGRRRLMVGGALIVAVSVAAYGAADGLAALVALRLVTGVGEAGFLVAAMASASDLAPPSRRGEAMSLLSVGIYGGVALGPVLGERALQGGGFVAVWAVAATAAAVAAVAATGRETLTRHSSRGESRRLLPRDALVPGAVLAASGWSLAGFNALLALHAREVGLGGAGSVFALFAAVVLAVRVGGARIPDRLGPRRTARGALSVTACGMAVMGLVPTPAGLVAGTAVFAVGQSLAFPGLAALALARVSPQERGAVFATMTGFLDLAFGLGALSLGALATSVGITGSFLAAAVVAAAGRVALGRTGSSVDQKA
jgi:MFS family permease